MKKILFLSFLALAITNAACAELDDGTDLNPTSPATDGGSATDTGGAVDTGGGSAIPANTIVCKATANSLDVSLRGPLLHTLIDGNVVATGAPIPGSNPLPGAPAWITYAADTDSTWVPRSSQPGTVRWVSDSASYTLHLPPATDNFNLTVLDAAGNYKFLNGNENVWHLVGDCRYYNGTKIKR